jgi:hypothetical protein
MNGPPAPARQDLLVIGALAVAAHATALAGGFIWLDHAHLEDGLALAGPSHVLELFTRGFAGTGFYRPLVSLSLSLDAALSGAPFLFRAVTLAWHALAAVSVAVAARSLGLGARAALIAGLAFAVHPLTSLVASATAFRSESMSLVCLLGLLVAHRAARPGWAAFALAAGALTKESVWVLGPLLLGALELAEPRKTRLRVTPLIAAEGAAFVAVSAVRWAFAPSFRATHLTLSPGEAIGTRLATFAKSMLALVLPIDPTFCDAFPVTSLGSVSALVGGGLLAGIAWLAYRQRGIALLFALSLLPTLQLVPIMRWWSPHYLYVPLAFAAMLLGQRAERWGSRPLLTLGVAGLACAGLSLADGRRYANDTTLFTPEVVHEPACREAQFFLGEAARLRQRWAEAATRYERAATPAPGVIAYADELAALENLGAARLALGERAEAKAAWSAALARAGGRDEARRVVHNLAVLALQSGDAREAARLLEPEAARPDAMPASLAVRARALELLAREGDAAVLAKRLAP